MKRLRSMPTFEPAQSRVSTRSSASPHLAEKMKRCVMGAAIVLLSIGIAHIALAGPGAVARAAVPAGCVPPAWPDTPVRFDEAPSIILELLIDAGGAVRQTHIVRSSGSRKFDDAAIVALSRCIYSRVARAGEPTGGWVQVHYRWTLE